MQELIDLLISDPDMLPCEAAERISVRRIASSESDRTAAEIMEPIPTLSSTGTVRQAAQTLVETGSPILAVVDKEGKLAGVITEWDITRATATAFSDDLPLEEIMTRKVITVSPSDGILEIVRKLEHYEISAMPVVDGQQVLGLVSGDMLARKSLPKLLQTQLE
jgi:CBS domain-containing protein